MGRMQKKIIACLMIVFQFFSYAWYADAIFGLFGGGSGSGNARGGINSFIENDLNINVQKSLKPISEKVNMYDRKGDAPEVSIRYSTPNPKPGEVVTASADAKGLSNANDAYYAWYIRNDNKRLASLPDTDRMRVYQINAIRAQAGVYFDPMSLDQAMNGGNGNGEFSDEYDAIMTQTNDHDEFQVTQGGNNGIHGGDHYCYVYDPDTGVQYELNGEGEGENSGCPDGYKPRCMVEERELQCPVSVPAIEGEITSTTEETEQSSETSSQGTIGGNGGARTETITQCLDMDFAPTCGESHTLFCSADDAENNVTYSYDGAIATPTPFCVKKNEETGELWSDPNANGCTDGTAGKGCMGYVDDGYLATPEACDIDMIDNNEEKSCEDVSLTIKNFDEKLYQLDPRNNRTTPLAQNDGAFVAGLGVKELTWKYEEGDEIGVVVEGTGLQATKHEDNTYQTVFAMMQPGCKEQLSDLSDYDVLVKEKSINIKTARVDGYEGTKGIGACVLKNNLFTSPGTSEYDALNVSVSTGASTSGAAIPSGIDQPIHISATAGQIQGGSISNAQKLYYEWSVACNGQDITDDLNLSTTEGMNIPALDFPANFPDKCFTDGSGQAEITVTTKINEPRQGGGSNFGQTTKTFTVFNAKNNPIKVYKTQANGTQFTSTNEEICTEGIDNTLCRVMNNEVIAVKAPSNIENGMTSWQVNGKSYTCDSTVSAECTDGKTATGTIIIPMTGRSGDIITVMAQTSTVDKDTNQSAQIIRSFRITDPEVTIEPVSGATKKVLGTYTDLDDQQFPDESSKVLIAQEGQTVTLTANLYPGFLNSQEDAATYLWTVNGEEYTTEKTIQLVPEGATTVSVVAKREMSMDDRWAQNQAFNAAFQDTTPTTFSASVNITLDKESLTKHKGITGFFASVSQNTPFYFLFILKMALIMSIMLFVPSLVLSIGGKSA